MKVIFVDVDNVLNDFYTKILLRNCITFVEDSKLELLKQLIVKTSAKLVLSSTWRQGFYDIENGIKSSDASDYISLKEKFAEFGLEIFGHTPIINGNMNHRGEEIAAWLSSWEGKEIESFAILDDLNGCYLRPVANRLIRTSVSQGLEQKHIDLAVKILENPISDKEKQKWQDMNLIKTQH